MKKIITALAVFGLMSGAVFAQTTTSANVVGYTKVDIVGGQLKMLSINWSAATNTIPGIFGDQLAGGSVINIWDKSAKTYVTSTKGRSGWDDTTTTIETGDAVWVNAAASATLILSGDVLMSDTNTVSLDGLDMTGFYYPVDVAWTNTDLSAQLPGGSVINVWNGSDYDTYTKGRSGWDGSPTIEAASGFWVSPASATTWSEERPF